MQPDAIRKIDELEIDELEIDNLGISTLKIANRAIEALEIRKPEIVPASLLICCRRSATLGEQRGPATPKEMARKAILNRGRTPEAG